MTRRKWIGLFLVSGLLLPVSALANSSWIWLSNTRPYDLLPIVALITILLESTALWLVLDKMYLRRIVIVVLFANLFSFLAPYALLYFEVFTMRLYPFWQTLEKGPYFTVGSIYLFATLLIELPVIYCSLRNRTKRKGLLMIIAAGSNTATTLITAVAERMCCYGHW